MCARVCVTEWRAVRARHLGTADGSTARRGPAEGLAQRQSDTRTPGGTQERKLDFLNARSE